MILFYSVTFKIITTFHILQYQKRKLYQREANKNIHGIGKHCEGELWIMTKLNEPNERTNKEQMIHVSNFRQRLTEIFTRDRLLIEVKFYENTYRVLPSSSH